MHPQQPAAERLLPAERFVRGLVRPIRVMRHEFHGMRRQHAIDSLAWCHWRPASAVLLEREIAVHPQ
jgi:hypothetical protein